MTDILLPVTQSLSAQSASFANGDPEFLAELQAKKALGRAHLEENRIEEALRIFADVLRQYPDDLESYLILGDCYLAEGEAETALLLYGQAARLSAGNADIERRIRLAKMERRLPEAAMPEALPTNPQAIASLLQQLTGRKSSVSDEEIAKAAAMLEQIINCQQPAQAVADHLDEIDALLPALLELNIRQARSDGRPDLVKALQELLQNIYLQLDSRQANQDVGFVRHTIQSMLTPRRVLFVSSMGGEALTRLTLPAGALSDLGCEVAVMTEFPSQFQEHFDLVVAHNPHGNPKLLQGLAACSASHIPIILTLDADFEQMHISHPDHATLGLGTPVSAKAYTAALLLADLICVPSETLATRLRSKGYRVQVIPEGWNKKNELWQKPSPRRSTLNLGWIGLPDQVEDMASIRRVLIRVMREFSHIRLVIVSDPQIYQLFDNLPESRRLFLPAVNLEDYPYLLGQIDVLLAPLRNTPFNQTVSERRLMEAGVRRIPWVASPVPAYVEWNEGGLLANTADEWHSHLRHLVVDPELRASLGRAGRRKAEEYEMEKLGRNWLTVINSVITAI